MGPDETGPIYFGGGDECLDDFFEIVSLPDFGNLIKFIWHLQPQI